MAKQGGSLTANTNAEVLAADETRYALYLENVSATDTIYYEFGAAASTTSTDDNFVLPAGAFRTFHASEWPEIKKTVNLKSTGTPQYIARDSGL